ncbi:MAG: hypothetical protein QW837_09255 [Conexivisphaerales archaeon]
MISFSHEPGKLRGFSDSLQLSIVIESWYWAYRMLSERHEVVKLDADKGHSFGQGEERRIRSMR